MVLEVEVPACCRRYEALGLVEGSPVMVGISYGEHVAATARCVYGLALIASPKESVTEIAVALPGEERGLARLSLASIAEEVALLIFGILIVMPSPI